MMWLTEAIRAVNVIINVPVPMPAPIDTIIYQTHSSLLLSSVN